MSIRTVGICGIGQMGAAAAVSFERDGFRVLLWGRDPRKLAAVSPQLDQFRAFLRSHIGPPPCDAGSVTLTGDLAIIDAEADLVMDAIAEVMDQKVDLFTRLRGAFDRSPIFITTTSGLSITELGRRSGCGPRLAGTHFWNPPHLMPLVEVVRGRLPAAGQEPQEEKERGPRLHSA